MTFDLLQAGLALDADLPVRTVVPQTLQGRQVTRFDDAGTAGEDEGPLHHVAQLTHIAGPVVGQQGPQRLGREHRHRPVAGTPPGEMGDQRGNVLAPLAQGRHGDLEGADAVVEIRAELAFAHHARQIPVGGEHHPHVGAQVGGGAHPPEAPGLEHAQELGLHDGADLADLVEEQGALRSGLDEARLAPVGAGEGAPLVAEEL